MGTRRTDILNTATRLFSEHGIEAVSTHQIARELGITQGNLTYHFPSKTVLIETLMEQLLAEIDQALALENNTAFSSHLLQHYHQVKIIFREQLRYGFMFDKRYAEVVTSMPAMQQRLQVVLAQRFLQSVPICQQFVDEQTALPSLMDHLKELYHVLNILALYWHQEVAIYYPHFDPDEKVAYALAIYFQAYKPYLTEKGLGEILPLLLPLKEYSAQQDH